MERVPVISTGVAQFCSLPQWVISVIQLDSLVDCKVSQIDRLLISASLAYLNPPLFAEKADRYLLCQDKQQKVEK